MTDRTPSAPSEAPPRALVVMIKDPAPGRVKTRLCPPLSVDEAAGLYACFLSDLFTRLAPLAGVGLFAACALEEGQEGIKGLIAPVAGDVAHIIQEGEGLGERMRNVFEGLFFQGYGPVVMIGSDSPDIPLEFIDRAFALLEDADLVLGPATDGGYYLVGLNSHVPALFDGVPWSTDKVLDETVKKARSLGLALELLDEWHDIDTPEDLSHLRDNPKTPESSAFLMFLDKKAGGGL